MAKILSMMEISSFNKAYELVKVELTDAELSADVERPLLSSLYPSYRYVSMKVIDNERLLVLYLCSRSKSDIPTKVVDFLCNIIKFTFYTSF